MRAAARALVIVFARAPLAGQAKTRLAPRLGAAGAARLQARLAFAALHTAREARCGPVELHLTARHSLFAGKAPLRVQRGADLGARMHHALVHGLRRHGAAILIGADCPALRPEDLRRAARLLAGGCDVVLAPAEDGGYALIAARRVSPLLFQGVPWGGAEVCAETLRRLARLGYRSRLLRTVWDVDRPEDLERLRSPRFASALRRCARR
jgi:hypothetical protein